MVMCWDAHDKFDSGQEEELYAWEWAKCIESGVYGKFVNPGDYFELRDISLTVPVGRFVPGTSSAMLTVSSRNLWYWTKRELRTGHPESLEVQINGSPIIRQIGEQLPPSSSFVISLRATF